MCFIIVPLSGLEVAEQQVFFSLVFFWNREIVLLTVRQKVVILCLFALSQLHVRKHEPLRCALRISHENLIVLRLVG